MSQNFGGCRRGCNMTMFQSVACEDRVSFRILHISVSRHVAVLKSHTASPKLLHMSAKNIVDNPIKIRRAVEHAKMCRGARRSLTQAQPK